MLQIWLHKENSLLLNECFYFPRENSSFILVLGEVNFTVAFFVRCISTIPAREE
jgi:hypothetical protein